MYDRPIRTLLKLEWLAAALAAIVGYWMLGASWWLFLALILVPDISMLGYLAGSRFGAATYNACHILLWPALLVSLGFLLPSDTGLAVGLIWLIHIAVDRALGYGLKLPTGFQDTHLGRIGGRQSAT